MSQSLSKINIHLVFSTKNRQPLISFEHQSELYAYTATILKNLECPVIVIGGTEDHIHILCVQSKNISLSDLVRQVKATTSKWMKSKSPQFNDFHWQSGYGAFSVSESHVERVRKYIVN